MGCFRPMIGETVTVVDNETMKAVSTGKLIGFTRTHITIGRNNKHSRHRFSVNLKEHFDAMTHHFRGCEPPVMLIRRDGKLVRKERIKNDTNNNEIFRRLF